MKITQINESNNAENSLLENWKIQEAAVHLNQEVTAASFHQPMKFR